MSEYSKFFYSIKEHQWKCLECNVSLTLVPREGMVCPNCGEGMIELITGEGKEKP